MVAGAVLPQVREIESTRSKFSDTAYSSSPTALRASSTSEPSYQAHVWDVATGKRLRKTFPTISAARRWRQDAVVDLRRGDLSAGRSARLNEAAEAWLMGLRGGAITNRSGDSYKPVVMRDYTRIFNARILPRLGHLRLNEITTRDVQSLVDDLVEAGAKPATIDTALTPLRAFYRRAVARGEARANPTVGVEKPAVRCAPKAVVSPADAERMIAALDGADRVLWALAFYTGMRLGELIALRREDVDLATGIVHVRRGWDECGGEIAPKSRKGRPRIPVAAVLRDHLDQHLLDLDGERIFTSQWWIAKAAERAHKVWRPKGLPLVQLHDCRHTFASFAIDAGMNAKTLSALLGHATIAVTFDLYGHLLPGSEDEVGARLDAYFQRHSESSTVAQTVAHPAELAA
jgi:integrase